jgi:hypothetical protein
MTQEPPREPHSVRNFVGWALIVLGVLWMAFAGVCTISVMSQGGTDNSGWAVLILVVGALSVLAGFGVFRLGRWLARS